MIRRIIKYLLWIAGSIVGLLLLISILVYIPPIQKFVKNKAASYLYDNMGIGLDIERLRLKFPVRLELDRTDVVMPSGDTLIRFNKAMASVALFPLISGDVRVKSFTLSEADVHYRDTISAMDLRAAIDEITMATAKIRPGAQTVDVPDLALKGAKVKLSLGESAAVSDSSSAAWLITAGRLRLDDVDAEINMQPGGELITALLSSGTIEEVTFDMASKFVGVGLVDMAEGNYAYLFSNAAPDSSETAVETVTETLAADSTASGEPPWTISVGRVRINDTGIRYGLAEGIAAAGFDPQHIEITGLNVSVDSIRNLSSNISLNLRELSLSERSGLEVRSGEGYFAMDSLGVRLHDFVLETAASRITASITGGDGIMQMDPDAHLSFIATANINANEVAGIITFPPDMQRALAGKTLTLDADAGGELGDMSFDKFRIQVPGTADLNMSGRVASVTDFDNLSGHINVTGDFRDIGFIREMLPDPALRERIGFPARMTLDGNIGVAAGAWSPDIKLTADGGNLTVAGTVNLRSESYDASVIAESFPVYAFLPQDSLGIASLTLAARGNGFDPRNENAASDINLEVTELGYNGYDFSDIKLTAALASNKLTGTLHSGSESLDLGIGGTLSREGYSAMLKGALRNVDLQGMRFSETPLSFSGLVDISAAMDADSSIKARAQIDSLRLRAGDMAETVNNAVLTASAGRENISASLASGDLLLNFSSTENLNGLTSGFTAAATAITAQIDSLDINAARLQEALPQFRLTATAGRNNVLRNILRASDMDFRTVTLDARNEGERLGAGMVINGFSTSGLTLDTLNIGVWRREERLNYHARLRNRPGNIDQMALIAVRGSVQGNTATALLHQENREGRTGFNFGLNASLTPDAVTVTMTPENPTFGYVPWTVNSGNFLTYGFDREMSADLHVIGDNGRRFEIVSASSESMPTGAVRLIMAGIDIGEVLGLFPAMPPVDGTLGANMMVDFSGAALSADGDLSVGSLSYDKQRVGDLGLRLTMISDTTSLRLGPAALTLDGNQVLTANGTYDPSGRRPVDFRATLTAFPLAAANPFTAGSAVLSGTLGGQLALTGSTTADMIISGSMKFTDSRVEIPMVGTTYGISDSRITISRSQMRFRDFGFTAPNNSKMSIDGTVDMTDFSRMVADLRIFASDFDLVNSPRTGGSPVYGKASADINLTARGPMDALAIRGNMRLLNGTDVTYTMQDSSLDIESQQQDIVTFVSFDTLDQEDTATPPPAEVSAFGMDILANIDIDNGVKATVNLSAAGSDRAELVGEGALAFSMNTQGDTRLTGRYTLTGGRIIYSPPVISTKNFAINEGSYVEWYGELMNPRFNITATERVTSTVEFEGSSTERVNFDITLKVANSLKDMATTFDLSSDNLQAQNSIAQLTPEQRSNQAMNILLYNTYTGPGATGSVDKNNPVNSFISKELNQWARDNLKGVDVSVGIDSEEDLLTGSQHTNYSYSVSKSLFDDRIKLTVGGSVRSDQAIENQDAFINDVSITYRLTRRDNMFVKLYHHNVTSLLEGEITETGAGFILQRKMNRLSELFKLTPDPQKQQLRREQREERQGLRDIERMGFRDSLWRSLPDSVRRARIDSVRQARGEDYIPRRQRPQADSIRVDSLMRNDTVGISRPEGRLPEEEE